MGTIALISGQMCFDNNGVLAPGALAYFTDAGTTTPKTVYQDGDETTPHEDPVEADGNGRWPAIFVPFGSYKLRITTAGGSAIGSTIDDIPNAAPTDPTDTVDENALLTTGDIWFSLVNGTRAGAVRLNGRTIGNAASGATERANADTADLFAFLWNTLADAQAAVSSGRGASAAADYAANKTIALPDARRTALIGFDDMGNSAAGGLTLAPVVTGGPTTTGSILGQSTHTLTEAQLPAHTHGAGTFVTSSNGAHSHATTTDGAHTHGGATGNASADHTHNYNAPAHKNRSYATPGFAGDTWGGADTPTATGGTSATHTHSINSDGDHSHTTDVFAAHSHTVTGTSGSTGSSTAHNIVQRSLLGTWFIRL